MTSLLLMRVTVATLVAFTGGAVGAALGGLALRRLRILVYAAMAMLLFVTLFDVLPDAKALLTWPEFVLAGASGFALFWLLGKYVYHVCPACAISAFDTADSRLRPTVALLMTALSIHSTMDGLAVAVGDAVAGHPNILLLVGISIHKLPEGLALVLLLIGAGYSRSTAFLYTVAIESTTMLGGLIGIFGLHHVSLLVLGLIFAHVGGGFVYLILSTTGLFTLRSRAEAVRPGAMLIALDEQSEAIPHKVKQDLAQ
jgi:zinc transporter ZupT